MKYAHQCSHRASLSKVSNGAKPTQKTADLGAVQNRLDSAINNISTTEINISSARSRITDADYATAMSNSSTATSAGVGHQGVAIDLAEADGMILSYCNCFTSACYEHAPENHYPD